MSKFGSMQTSDRRLRLKILFFILILGAISPSSMAQAPVPYDQAWKQVDVLEDSLGQPRSALELVQTLYARARREHNQPQAIRAILYTIRINRPLEENADSTSILRLETAIDSFPAPARSILLSLAAQARWNAIQTRGFWVAGREDRIRQIDSLFSASLRDTALLGRTLVSAYEPVLEKGNVRSLRPTLLDLLANRAINFCAAGEHSVFVRERECSDPDVFLPARAFMVHPLRQTDTTVLSWKAIRLYQALLRFHSGDAASGAFLDADLNRLAFARQISTLDSADQYYERALRQLIREYAHRAGEATATNRLAEYLEQRGLGYETGSPDSAARWLLKEALGLCDQVIRTYPGTPDATDARARAATIRQPQIQVTTEHVNLPGQPILTSVGYKNCPQLHLRLLKAGDSVTALIRKGDARALAAFSPLRAWVQSLPDPGDHQLHRTEIPIAALSPGTYVLLASTNTRFGKDTLPVQTISFKVSDIGWVGTRSNSFFVLHRGSGEPISGARVHIWNTRGGLVEDYVTDKNGHIKLNRGTGGFMNLKMQVCYGDDSLSMDDETARLFYPASAPNRDLTPRFSFYTDRSVYRPGQTVYFKAIGVVRDTALDRDVPYRPGKPLPFYLEIQGQRPDSVSLEPGDFGSVHGSFTLPSVVKTGGFSIGGGGGQDRLYLAVEEYKRPRYAVAFEQPARQYRLGDTLDVKGHAKAFAGNPVAGARIFYTISRNINYPIRWDRPFGPIRHPVFKNLLRDSTRTGKDGSFVIRFVLETGPGGNRELDPHFIYTIHADVTDLNGETHPASFSLAAAYTSISLGLDLPAGSINADSLHTLVVTSTNRAGAPQRTLTTITLSRLEAPRRLLRKRSWEAPDLFALPEDTFHRLFPHDPYGDEMDEGAWPVGETILKDTLTTGIRSGLSLKGIHLRSGVYRVSVSARDHQGQPVTTGGFLEVYNPSDAQLPYPTYAWDLPGDQGRKDSITHYFGSSAGPRFVIKQVAQSAHIHIGHLRLGGDGNVSTISLPTVREGTGGFTFGLAYMADNRLYVHDVTVAPRDRDKPLTIHYASFRDKLEPGSAERLTLSIHGPGHEAADAEVLASMYDASLDQFATPNWSLPLLEQNDGHGVVWRSFGFDRAYGSALPNAYRYQPQPVSRVYDDLLDAVDRVTYVTLRGQRMLAATQVSTDNMSPVTTGFRSVQVIGHLSIRDPQDAAPMAPPVTFRKDFRETAFFYPDLHTDSAGNLSFGFTMPEALTRWTLRTLAHTRDLTFGMDRRDVVTQKTLMLQPNIPRFLREGDQAWLSVKVVNTAPEPLQGTVRLDLLDAIDMQPVDGALGNQASEQVLHLDSGSSLQVRFHLSVPVGFTRPLVYRLSASAGGYSDGEQGPIPVLNRRVLVTDTYPLTLSPGSSTRVQIDPLLHATPGSPYRLSLEYCASPVWYVARALPYLETGTDASPQSVSDRYYTNTLGAGILRTIPGIKVLLDTLRRDSSALDQDAELKNALLQETPWVMDAGREDASIRHLAAFLDSDRLARVQGDALHTLGALQYPSGAFPWFNEGPENRYVTEYILTQLGRLSDLRMLPDRDLPLWRTVTIKAIAYLDARLRDDYQTSKSQAPSVPSPEILQYLYTRSLFKDQIPDAPTREAIDFYKSQAKAQWVHANLYGQGLIALFCDRTGDGATPQAILTSLEQRSILSPDRGRYWKENEGGWSWSEAPIQTQALLITAFLEAGADAVTANQLRTWLLAQKQTQSWSSSPATADACYALLLGANWTTVPPALTARVGDLEVESHPRAEDAGSLFFKRQWEGAALQPSMGHIEASVTGKVSTVRGGNANWGAVYYQHFEDLDSLQATQTTLSVQKQLFVVSGLASTARPLQAGDTVHIGDRVRVRLTLRSDRPLEFVHLKDLRAACLEPVDVVSGYRAQGGLGYYCSPGDLSTNFYLDWLPKGTFILEYDQYVNMAGTFSGGMATLQSFYAPRFSSRASGSRINAMP